MLAIDGRGSGLRNGYHNRFQGQRDFEYDLH